MNITVKPDPKQKPRWTVPQSGYEFTKLQIRKKSLEKTFTVELAQNSASGIVNFLVTDGLKRKFRMQMIRGKSHWHSQCECDEFFEEEMNYCQHFAILENIESFLWLVPSYLDQTTWLNALKTEKTKIERNKVESYLIECFDSYEKKPYKVGRHIKGTQTVKIGKSIALERYEEEKKKEILKQAIVLDDSLSSKGILCNSINLYDYQEAFFKKFIPRERGICTLKMGQGKTLTAIACLGYVKKNILPNLKCLIIAPKSLKLQWQKELKRALALDSTNIQNTKEVNSKVKPGPGIDIVSYQTFAKNADAFIDGKYDFLIMDEIQFIRNDESKVWKAMRKIRDTRYILGLSGTVIENRLDDLYSVMNIINPKLLGPKWKFSDKFQNLIAVNKNQITYAGIKNVEELREIIKDYVYGVGNVVLPGISHVQITCEMSSEQRSSHNSYYDQAQTLLAKSLSSGLNFNEKALLQAFLLKARQACNTVSLITKEPEDLKSPSPKIAACMELIEQLCLVENEKVVFFSQWTEMLDIIKEFLDARGLKSVFYTGRESEKQRSHSLTSFQNDKDCKVFLATDSGGVGLDGLQMVSRYVIHFEQPWNPAKLDQRSGRVHRIGQTNPVTIYQFYSKDSIEEKILSLIEDKREIREMALYSDGS